jgi:hypothetical protein
MLDTLDTDRLHAVIEDKVTARGAGKTTAMLTQLLGIVQVGGPYAEVIIVAHHPDWAKSLTRQFSDVLSQEHITHNLMSPTEIHIVKSGQRFVFMSGDDILQNNRAAAVRLYNYFLDMPESYEAAYGSRLRTILESRLTFNGDTYAY